MLSKDADWFSRPGRLFIRNVSIDAPPLTPNRRSRPTISSAPRRLCRHGAGDAQALPMVRPARRQPMADRWRSAIPNATWCAASARPTASTLVQSRRRARCRRHLAARPARRHLHLHRRPAELGRGGPNRTRSRRSQSRRRRRRPRLKAHAAWSARPASITAVARNRMYRAIVMFSMLGWCRPIC